MKAVAWIFSIFIFGVLSGALSNSKSPVAELRMVAPEQAARIVSEFNHDSGLHKEIQIGLRTINAFITPDGTRSILVTSHHDSKTHRLLEFNSADYDLVCVERYALHPQKDFVVALSEESCFKPNLSSEM